MVSRRALVAGLAGFIAACAGPSRVPSPPPSPSPSPEGQATTTPASTSPPTPRTTAVATSAPTAVPAAASPTSASAVPEPTAASDQVALDLRLWNGSADVQLDGRPVAPGRLLVDRGPHQAAALVDGDVVSVADAPLDGGSIDLVVPPPLAGLAIMIENQADARPQTGLTQADVVYEALAEGGITRFIALFLSDDAPVVGPVRSLRHYFAFLAGDYGADVVHIGASPEGYAWRDAMNMGHLDETFGDPGVWRVRTRPPPHNAYTDTAADRGFLRAQTPPRQRNRLWGPLLFADPAPRGELSARSIRLGFRPWPYRVDYTFDETQGRYLRTMEGSPHRDAVSGEQIAPATVVIQYADVEAIPNDPKLRMDVNLVGGGGQLIVLSEGTRRDGTWTKPAPRSATIWLDPGGTPIVIPPGPVWVEVVPNESPVSIT